MAELSQLGISLTDLHELHTGTATANAAKERRILGNVLVVVGGIIAISVGVPAIQGATGRHRGPGKSRACAKGVGAAARRRAEGERLAQVKAENGAGVLPGGVENARGDVHNVSTEG